MRQFCILLVVWLLLGSACKKKEEFVDPPADLIGKEKMTSLLIDLHLAEAKMSYTGSRNADSIEIIYRNYEHAIFEEHNVTESVYLQSYEYYLNQMGELEEIYSAVVDSLSVMNSVEKAKDLGIANR